MLLACIIEPKNAIKNTKLIKSIFMSKQRKINIFDLSFNDFSTFITNIDKTPCEISLIKTSLCDFKILKSHNIKFDILIFDDIEESLKYDSFIILKNILSLLKQHAYLIINSDNFDFFNNLDLTNYHVITYGFNNNANLSTSSIGDFFNHSNFMCFLKKTVHSYNGMIFEPQEYVLNLSYLDNEPYTLLLTAVFAIISGIDLNSIT